MLGRSLLSSARIGARGLASAASGGYNVAVLGAAGGIGQPTSLILKSNPRVAKLSLYDIQLAPGVAADLSHIPTRAQVSGHNGPDGLGDALKGMDIVVIPAGVPRKPGMTRDDLFNTNASIVQSLIEGCAEHCPEAKLCIISNPVNSTVPIAAATLEKAGVYDPSKLFGVTTLDVLRANTFVAESQGWDPAKMDVPVVGGHAGTTILPLLSHVHAAQWSEEEIAGLMHRIQFGGDEVVKAKDGAGSATLSMAVAAARFADSLMRAADGEKVTECTFVESPVTSLRFFSSPVTLSEAGVGEIHALGELSVLEEEGLHGLMEPLGAQIQKGLDFVASNN